jgi:cytochrome c553
MFLALPISARTKALRGYKDNSRHGYDATMAETMASVSDDQILDLAYYLSQMK